MQLLDDYDHQTLFEEKNTENECIYTLSYEDCIEVIEQSSFDGGDLFGKERENGIAFSKELIKL